MRTIYACRVPTFMQTYSCLQPIGTLPFTAPVYSPNGGKVGGSESATLIMVVWNHRSEDSENMLTMPFPLSFMCSGLSSRPGESRLAKV